MLTTGPMQVKVGGNKVDHRTEGDVVGEIAIANPVERTADVVAESCVEAYILRRSNYRRLVETHPVLNQ